MTLNRKVLKRVYSPLKSPKRNNTSLRRKALIKQLNNEVQFGAVSKANLKVVVRVRPQNEREEVNNTRCVVKIVDDHMLIFDPKEDDDDFFFKGVRQRARDLNKRQPKEQKFVFEHVFNVDSSNEDIYEATTKDIVKTVLSGYNCSVFAYGATGAGKTFTMLGKTDCPGITFLTLMELYRCIEEIKEEKTCEVGISYIEVYNEMVRDLLQPGKPLNVQETGHQVLIPGLSLHKPSNAKELMEMLALGNQNRTQHPTDANAESSRSHAVFQVFVRQQDRTANVKNNVSIAKLSMIDLAGSERGNATGFKGARFREGASINKSLLALGNCINALADGQRHIPYRDSKLTRLLKDSLGGNCQSVMIAAVSPASSSFEDTYNTLRYANRAKTIKTTIKKNLLNVDQHVSNYVKIVEDLREEICSLKEKVKQYEEKENEWEAQRKTFTAASTQPLNLASLQQSQFEEKIAILEKQLQEKSVASNLELAEPPLSEEEVDIQKKLDEASIERKALRWELLQLTSSQRKMEFKIHTCTTHLHRMNIIAFASQRLDKSISKCERTIRNLNDRLSQINKLQKFVEVKLNANTAKLEMIQAELNQWGPNSSQPSKLSQKIIEKNEANLAVRDLYQLAEYLRGLVSEGFHEQNDSEQLINLLLATVKQFYVHLRAVNQCTPEIESLFKNVVESMDESKIIWADQQNDEKHIRNQNESTLPILDSLHFTSLPITSSIFISPTVTQDHKKFRKSSMKPTVSAPQPPDVPLQPPEPHEVFGTFTPTLPNVPDLTAPTTLVSHFEKCTFPKSPILSAFTYEKELTNDRRTLSVITTDLSKETPKKINCALLTPMKILPSTPVVETSVPSVLPDIKGNGTASLGFVSMVESSYIKPASELTDSVDITGNNFNIDLLQDGQPLESTMNATFAIIPAKTCMTMNTNCDGSVDSVESNAKSSDTLDSQYNSCNESLPPNPVVKGMPVSDKDNNVNVPNVISKHIADVGLTENSTTFTNDTVDCCIPLSVSHSSDPVNDEDSSLSAESRKTAQRKLFQPSVLDLTFSVDDKSESREDQQKLELLALNISPGHTTAKMKSLDDFENILRQAERPALISLQNKEESLARIPHVFITTPKETVATPVTQYYKGKFKKPLATPQKTPGKGAAPGKPTSTSKSVIKGKIQLSGNMARSTLRRSVSTTSLPSSQTNSSRILRHSPNVKKFTGFGRTLQRTTSFLKTKTSVGSNQENLPPVPQKVNFQSMSSTIFKDTVSSAAKQLVANYKP